MQKYREIYINLRERLQQGDFSEGDLLPSDIQLTRHFKVSRETVRRAMGQLASEGYVQRIKGRGTIALAHTAVAVSVAEVVSYQEFITQGDLKSETHVLSVQPSLQPRQFDLSREDNQLQTVEVVRLRVVDDIPTILDYDYINTAVVPDFPAVVPPSLFQYFEGERGLDIDYAMKTLTIEKASQLDQKYLKISADTPIVVIRSVTYLQDNQLLSCTESRHRADRFKGTEFARRRA